MKILKFLSILLLIPSLCFGAASRQNNGGAPNISTTGHSWSPPLTFLLWWKHDSSAGVAYSALDSSSGTWNGWFNFITTPVNNDFSANCGATGGANDVWQFHAGVTSASNSRKAYINAGGECTNTTSASPANDPDKYCVGGSCRNANDNYDDGYLAHAIVLKRALEVWEISQAMYLPESIPGAYLYWPMFGNSGLDLSGNARNGSVSGGSDSNDGPPVMFGGGLPL